jgi:uncharacterized protein YndB with AHSA1/START domain
MGSEIGRLHVRRSSFLQAQPERVWRELADLERLAAWFGQGQKLEQYAARLGGDAGATLAGYEAGWTTRHLVALAAIVEA